MELNVELENVLADSARKASFDEFQQDALVSVLQSAPFAINNDCKTWLNRKRSTNVGGGGRSCGMLRGRTISYVKCRL